jgi:hypothetical protein
MKVLHVYSHDTPSLAMYVYQLINALPKGIECMTADNEADMQKACKSFMPNIIHQHGAALVKNDTEARLIISPHGEKINTERAFAVIVRSPYELAQQNNSRCEMVRNPLITTTTDFNEAAKAISTVYQRVMDSQPLQLMNSQTRQAQATIIKVGICGDKQWVSNSNINVDAKDIDFRLLYIYAEQEGVAELLDKGIALLEIEAPAKQPTDNYLPKGYHAPKAMPHGATIPQMISDIATNGISLLRLAEITKALHDDSLDESSLIEDLEAQKLKPLFQAILKILSEQTLLTEGFMPCPPLDNKETASLRYKLANNLRII